MFILTCNGKTTEVFQPNQVGYVAHELADKQHQPVIVDQFDYYLGDKEPKHHVINVINPTYH